MKFQIQQKQLLASLLKVQKAVSQNRVVPAAECVRLTGKNNNIHFEACNLEVSIETDLELKFKGDFDFIVPAIKFIDYIKKLADQPIEIDVDDTYLVTIKHNSGNAKMQGETATDFPKIETKDGVKFTINDLASELYSVTYARGSADDPRTFISSVWMDNGNLIAGDGHVIAVNKAESDFNIKALLPTKVTDVLASLDGNAEIEISKESITVILDTITVKSRLIDDKFPEWRNVIPTPEITIEVKKSELLASIDRVIGFSNQNTKLVKLTSTGSFLTIEASNNELNEASIETITCSPGDISIQFKGALLLAALPKFTSEVIKIKYTNERTAVIVTNYDNDDYFALIMPTT